jgi:hypothetical protein
MWGDISKRDRLCWKGGENRGTAFGVIVGFFFGWLATSYPQNAGWHSLLPWVAASLIVISEYIYAIVRRRRLGRTNAEAPNGNG